MTDSTSTSSTHGHEVMRLLGAAESGLTRAELAAAAAARCGEDASFHTCAAEGMTLDRLLVFLAERGKVVERDGRLHAELGRMCNHDG